MMEGRARPQRTAILILAGCLVLAALILAYGIYLRFSAPRDPGRVEFWLYKLENGDAKWRANAANILAARLSNSIEQPDEIEGIEPKRPAIEAALIKALEDPEARVRANAVFGLRNIQSARPFIEQAANDRSADVREIAHAVLSNGIDQE